MDFIFQPHTPPCDLAPYLRQSFYARGQIPYRADKILPNGLAVLVFNLGEPHRLGKSEKVDDNPAFADNWLSGVQTTPLFNLPSGETHVVGLLFEPIGLHALTGLDMREVADRTLDARDVLPPDLMTDLGARLDQADHAALFCALQDMLPGRPLPPWLRDLYGELRTTDGSLRLRSAYSAAGVTPRHIADRFRRATGVSPKVLARILRLQALLNAIDPAERVNWTELAHAFGFYDQPHFNREFRRFSGLHPGQYLAQRQRDLPGLTKGEAVSFAPQR